MFFCSELHVEWMRECNRLCPELMLRDFDSELTAPSDLFDYYKQTPQHFRLKEMIL